MNIQLTVSEIKYPIILKYGHKTKGSNIKISEDYPY